MDSDNSVSSEEETVVDTDPGGLNESQADSDSDDQENDMKASKRDRSTSFKKITKANDKLKKKEKQKINNQITKEDYYDKNQEFCLWLKEEKHLEFRGLNTNQAKFYFKEFVKKWNTKQLGRKFYRGVDAYHLYSSDMLINQSACSPDIEAVKIPPSTTLSTFNPVMSLTPSNHNSSSVYQWKSPDCGDGDFNNSTADATVVYHLRNLNSGCSNNSPYCMVARSGQKKTPQTPLRVSIPTVPQMNLPGPSSDITDTPDLQHSNHANIPYKDTILLPSHPVHAEPIPLSPTKPYQQGEKRKCIELSPMKIDMTWTKSPGRSLKRMTSIDFPKSQKDLNQLCNDRNTTPNLSSTNNEKDIPSLITSDRFDRESSALKRKGSTEFDMDDGSPPLKVPSPPNDPKGQGLTRLTSNSSDEMNASCTPNAACYITQEAVFDSTIEVAPNRKPMIAKKLQLGMVSSFKGNFSPAVVKPDKVTIGNPVVIRQKPSTPTKGRKEIIVKPRPVSIPFNNGRKADKGSVRPFSTNDVPDEIHDCKKFNNPISPSNNPISPNNNPISPSKYTRKGRKPQNIIVSNSKENQQNVVFKSEVSETQNSTETVCNYQDVEEAMRSPGGRIVITDIDFEQADVKVNESINMPTSPLLTIFDPISLEPLPKGSTEKRSDFGRIRQRAVSVDYGSPSTEMKLGLKKAASLEESFKISGGNALSHGRVQALSLVDSNLQKSATVNYLTLNLQKASSVDGINSRKPTADFYLPKASSLDEMLVPIKRTPSKDSGMGASRDSLNNIDLEAAKKKAFEMYAKERQRQRELLTMTRSPGKNNRASGSLKITDV